MVSRKENGKALFDQIMTLTLCNNYLKDLSGLRPLDKWRILNLKFKLPYQMLYKVDRASMFNSVEARPLFLNNDIIDAALSISSSVMMEDGQKLFKKITSKSDTHSGWNLPKTGFGWKTNSYGKIFNDEANFFKTTNQDR